MSLRKYLAEVEQVVAEAIPLGKAMTYRRAWDPTRYKDIFMSFPPNMRDKNGFRLYLPYEKQETVIAVPYDLKQYLAQKEYVVSDYVAGLATKTGDKRQVKIGRLLADNPELLKRFMNDPRRALAKSAGKLVCISRHPYDVTGSSTDRGWSSCMDLINPNGFNRRYVLDDIKEGTVVAYLIHADDKNIKNPISRLLIKPFISADDPDDILLATDAKQYGTDDRQFGEIVEDSLEKINGPDKRGMYRLNKKLYNDGKSLKFAGGTRKDASPEGQRDFIYEYLRSVDAMPSMLKIDGDNYILEDWRGIGRFCSDVDDDTLSYLITLYEDQAQLGDVNIIGRQEIADTLRLLPDNLLHGLCKRFCVPFKSQNTTEASSMITSLSYNREIGEEIRESIAIGSNLMDTLRERIDLYIDNGWRFEIYDVWLHVPKNGDDYDLDAPVELRIHRDDMMQMVENHMEDPDGENGGNGHDELYRLCGYSGTSWSSLEDGGFSEWRGEYADEHLTDREGNDLVFGSKRKPKINFEEDATDNPQMMADSYIAFLRGENSSHIKSDQQPDFFESHMRTLINMIDERRR